jgi:hypothetical protein
VTVTRPISIARQLVGLRLGEGAGDAVGAQREGEVGGSTRMPVASISGPSRRSLR